MRLQKNEEGANTELFIPLYILSVCLFVDSAIIFFGRFVEALESVDHCNITFQSISPYLGFILLGPEKAGCWAWIIYKFSGKMVVIHFGHTVIQRLLKCI